MITTRKFQSIHKKEVTDEDNSQNEIGHWTNSGIRVALQSWLWVQVEITAIANSNQSFLFKFQIYIFKYINQPETGIDCYVIRNYYSKPWWIQFHFLKMLWSTMQCTITLSLVSNIGCKTIFWINEMESEKIATLYLLFLHQLTISPEPLVKKCLPSFLHE